MATICPLCSSQIQENELGELPLCPVCGAFVGTVEDDEEAVEETDDTEYITICERCGHFAIMARKEKFCAMCRGEVISIMSRKKWSDMSEAEKQKTAQRYLDIAKGDFHFNHTLHKLYGSTIRVDKNMLVYCPRCGEYTSAHFAEHKSNRCTFCGVEFQMTDELFHDVHQKILRKLGNGTVGDIHSPNVKNEQYEHAMMEYLLERYLKNERIFDPDAMALRLKKKGV